MILFKFASNYDAVLKTQMKASSQMICTLVSLYLLVLDISSKITKLYAIINLLNCVYASKDIFHLTFQTHQKQVFIAIFNLLWNDVYSLYTYYEQ